MKSQRFVVVSDNHGDCADAKAVAAMFDFVKHWKPHHRIHLGDNFDFRCLRKKASDEERRDGLSADIDAGLEFLWKFRPTVFVRGNHDERLYDLKLSDDHKMADLVTVIIDDISDALGDAVVLPYNKRTGLYELGDLNLLHGYASGETAARTTTIKYGVDVMMGHGHAIDCVSIPGKRRRVGQMIGCLCDINQSYNRAQLGTLRQEHGFAYGLSFPSGAYVAWQARCVDGAWHFPSEIRSYGA